MNDLISRSALLEKETNVTKYDEGGWGIEFKAVAVYDLLKAPAVDAVEVVRCKDCKYLYDGVDDYCCARHAGLVKNKPDSFCSYGERKVDNAD